jgi:hypothetical protein
LKIAIDSDDQFTGRSAEPASSAPGLAVVSVEVKRGNLGVLRRQAIQFLTAAIVHENDFERTSLRGRMGIHDGQQSPNSVEQDCLAHL